MSSTKGMALYFPCAPQGTPSVGHGQYIGGIASQDYWGEVKGDYMSCHLMIANRDKLGNPNIWELRLLPGKEIFPRNGKVVATLKKSCPNWLSDKGAWPEILEWGHREMVGVLSRQAQQEAK